MVKAASKRVRTGTGSYGSYAGMPAGATRGRGGFWGDVWGGIKSAAPVGLQIANTLAGAAAGSRGVDPSIAAAYGRRSTRGGGAYTDGPMMSTLLASPVPAMHSSEESVKVHKVEYLGDLITSVNAGEFKNTSFPLNPGICLYWGKHLAALFQQWRLEGAIVYFKSRSSSYTATTGLGTVMMCCDYNTHNSAFTNKQQMQETTGSVACCIDQNASLGIECDTKMTMSPIKFIRMGDLPSGVDLHLYDWGNLQIATAGCAANVNIGELYISYDITFFKPKAQFGTELDSAHYTTVGNVDASPLGTAVTKVFDTMGLTIDPVARSITFSSGTSGKFLIMIHSHGDNFHASGFRPPVTNTLVNCSLVTTRLAFTGSVTGLLQAPQNTVQAKENMWALFIKITNPGVPASVTFSADAWLPNTNCTGDITVTEINWDEP